MENPRRTCSSLVYYVMDRTQSQTLRHVRIHSLTCRVPRLIPSQDSVYSANIGLSHKSGPVPRQIPNVLHRLMPHAQIRRILLVWRWCGDPTPYWNFWKIWNTMLFIEYSQSYYNQRDMLFACSNLVQKQVFVERITCARSSQNVMFTHMKRKTSFTANHSSHWRQWSCHAFKRHFWPTKVVLPST